VNFKEFFKEAKYHPSRAAGRIYKAPKIWKDVFYIEKDTSESQVENYKFTEKQTDNSVARLFGYNRKGNVHAASVFDPLTKITSDLKLFLFHLSKARREKEKPSNDPVTLRLRSEYYDSVVDNTASIVNNLLIKNPEEAVLYIHSTSPFNKAVQDKVGSTDKQLIPKNTLGDLIERYKKDPRCIDKLVVAPSTKDSSPRSLIAKNALISLLKFANDKEDLKNKPLSVERVAELIINNKLIDLDKVASGDRAFASRKDWLQDLYKPEGFFNFKNINIEKKSIIVIDDNINTKKTYEEINQKISEKYGIKNITWVVGIIPNDVLQSIK
jgi:hypothetical protein